MGQTDIDVEIREFQQMPRYRGLVLDLQGFAMVKHGHFNFAGAIAARVSTILAGDTNADRVLVNEWSSFLVRLTVDRDDGSVQWDRSLSVPTVVFELRLIRLLIRVLIRVSIVP